MVSVLQVCEPVGRALLTVHLRGASASREAASPAASPRRRLPFIHTRRRRAAAGGGRWGGNGNGDRTWEGRSREPGAGSPVRVQAERSRPPLGFLEGAAPRGEETMLIIVPPPRAGPQPCRPIPATPRPAPGKFPPSAGLGPGTLPQTQIPRCAFSQAVAPRRWAADFPPAAGPWGSHPPEFPAPVGMLRRTAEIAPSAWAGGSAGTLEAAAVPLPGICPGCIG